MTPIPQGCVKKPYQEPNLRLYGDVQTLTKLNVHHLGPNDGMPNKT